MNVIPIDPNIVTVEEVLNDALKRLDKISSVVLILDYKDGSVGALFSDQELPTALFSIECAKEQVMMRARPYGGN